jgi:hypothetical protein
VGADDLHDRSRLPRAGLPGNRRRHLGPPRESAGSGSGLYNFIVGNNKVIKA